MKIRTVRENLQESGRAQRVDTITKKKAMTSRAELLADLEEKRQETKEIEATVNDFSISEPEAADGYNPYDNPGLGKEMPDDADITARRRKIMQRLRKP